MNLSSRWSLAVLLGAVALAGAPSFARAEPAGAEQAKRVLDVRVPDEGVVQRLTLTDGSQIFGRVESIVDDAIVFRSLAGVELKATRAEIADLRMVSGRVIAGEFQPTDSHNTRLLFAPTGRSLKKGEGYFGVYEIVLPFVQADRSAGGRGGNLRVSARQLRLAFLKEASGAMRNAET